MFKLTEEIINDSIEIAHKILKEVYPKYKEPIIYSIKITNAHSYWANIGRDKESPNSFAIHISRTFEKIPDPIRAETRFHSCMIHELIHTIPGCNNHGKKFKHICSLINNKYPKYKIQTSTSSEDYGVNIEAKSPKYICHCKNCNMEYFYFRKPNYNISLYLCKCGKSNLELLPYKNNQNKN